MRAPAALRVVAALAVAIAALGCKKRPKKSNPLEDVYFLRAVGEVRIELSDDAVARLDEAPKKWVRGSATVLGSKLTDVAVRLKGHRSLRNIDDKPSLRLQFDRFVPGRELFGTSEITLNNMVEDPTMMREYLGYRLYRAAGVHAPNAGYAEVYINGDLRGLYLVLESPNEAFLRRNFGDPLGLLYEGEYGCDLYPGDVDGFDRDFGPKGERVELASLARVADEGAQALLYDPEHPIATEQFHRYLATSAFIADFDGYRHAHNYRIYLRPSDELWYFLPWGIDRSFKKDLGLFDSFGRVASLCFSDERCTRDYLRTLQDVIEEFERLDFDEGVDVVQSITSEKVKRDPKRPYSVKEIAQSRKKLRTFIRSRPALLRGELGCLGAGTPVDADGDGYSCRDCDDDDPAIHPGAAERCGDSVDSDCSGGNDDSAGCDCETLEVGETTFHLCDYPRSWEDADEMCRAKGLRLAKIDSAEQNRQLFEKASSINRSRWWIGLSDRRDENVFLWTDGSAPEVTVWGKGEPDNNTCNQDCAALPEAGRKDQEKRPGHWRDTHCAQPYPFVCR